MDRQTGRQSRRQRHHAGHGEHEGEYRRRQRPIGQCATRSEYLPANNDAIANTAVKASVAMAANNQ